MKLYVIRAYKTYQPGDIIEVSPQVAAAMLVDSPGTFSRRKPQPFNTSITEQAVEVKQ